MTDNLQATMIVCHYHVISFLLVIAYRRLLMSGDVELNPGPLVQEMIEKILSTIDDTTFDEDGWNEVILACSSLALKWRDLSGYLGISLSTIRMIKDKNPDDSTGVASLNEALEQWILQNYNTKKHGLPSWKTLLKAVSLVDQSTFEKLAKEHQLEGKQVIEGAQCEEGSALHGPASEDDILSVPVKRGSIIAQAASTADSGVEMESTSGSGSLQSTKQVVMETEIPHCIVAQIRKKYSTITNTYKKQCPCQLKNIASLELVEELQCSSSRSRKEMGKRVHLPYNRLFKGPNGRKKNSKRILIMGEPGVGKTILCASIAEDWAKGKFFQEFLVVVFLPLNQRYIASAQNLQELLKSVYEFDSETCSTAIMHLRANEKDNVLIIADGWDDLRESESQQGSFLHNLLFGNLLPSSSLTVVVTSRSATNPCHFIDQFIAVQGFSENTTKSYIQNELSSNPEKLKHVTEQIDTSALVETMCSVPLNLALICNFYQSCDDDLPSTMPEIYGKIAWNLAHMKINGTKKYGRILKLSNYQDLPEELRQTWLHFCQLAFQTVEKCHATVSQEDISSFVTFKLEAFGLLKPIVSSGGDEVTFSFLHPAFRYYLASLHLTMQPQSVQLKAIETMGHALAPCFGDFF